MMNAALKAAIVELGLCTVDSMKSCVREEVHAANQMHDQRFQQIEASQTSMKQNLDALDAKFAQLEAKLQDAPMSAPVSPRTLKASVEAAVKKTMHRNASAPCLDKFAYDFNQIEVAKTQLKITYKLQQFDSESADSKVAGLFTHVGCSLPYTIMDTTTYKKSNSTDVVVDMQDIDGRNTLRNLLSKYDDDKQWWVPSVEGIEARIVKPAFEENRYKPVSYFRREAAAHYGVNVSEIKFEKSTGKITHNGKHIATQRRLDYKVIAEADAFA